MQQQQYICVKYDHHVFEIPVRRVDQKKVILFSDIQAVVPKATALLVSQSTKVVPFDLAEEDKRTKRISAELLTEDVYQVYVPPPPSQAAEAEGRANAELQIKLDQLTDKVDQLVRLVIQQQQQAVLPPGALEEETLRPTTTASAETAGSLASFVLPAAGSPPPPPSQQQQPQPQPQPQPPVGHEEEAATEEDDDDDDAMSSNQQQEAPPSYETSVYSTIKTLNRRLLEFESHIPNKHKSPKWLSKRKAWVAQVTAAATSSTSCEPQPPQGQEESREDDTREHGSPPPPPTTTTTENSHRNPIHAFAMSLIQLEMALLWSAVTEEWIQQERDTWINLLGNARSERHLAGALISLERHTLVMDPDWTVTREVWVNELLDIMTHFL
ncbi:hypothetical protein BDF20DRAFT_883403 [Mycotypha africana]|uniref:uncharacterized protein n=1 Tax=Mycotypha africana TaxID=64632 RepID=UPI002301576B|nr:uncharacterized protein BDF20DRAFT_883403 [Mycotypha africana]KAI8973643.1 hypothetical protein BDF20DRAFT_883403 [Mycotypha africana]